MATKESSASAHPSTDLDVKGRVLRGLKLFRERSGEIEPLGYGVYSVPSCSGKDAYAVHLDVFGEGESCSCRGFGRREAACKRITAATIYRAKARMRMRKESEAKRRGRDVRPDGLVEKLGA